MGPDHVNDSHDFTAPVGVAGVPEQPDRPPAATMTRATMIPAARVAESTRAD